MGVIRKGGIRGGGGKKRPGRACQHCDLQISKIPSQISQYTAVFSKKEVNPIFRILVMVTTFQARSQGGGPGGLQPPPPPPPPPRKKLNFRKNKPPSPLHGRLVTGLCL